MLHTHTHLGATTAQVMVPLAGNITMGSNVLLTCPQGSNIVDTYGGLYGLGSYPIQSDYCGTTDPQANTVLASTLQFTCTQCGPGQYTMFAGSSEGSPGTAPQYPCWPCPVGGTCANGVVTAVPGYWGARGLDPTAQVDFAICPEAYCCDGKAAPCSTMDACQGNRTGLLCGGCREGYGEVLGSAECVAVGDCGPGEQALAWVVVLVALVGMALAQFTVVSGVWWCHTAPTGRMKLGIYFAQVRLQASALGTISATTSLPLTHFTHFTLRSRSSCATTLRVFFVLRLRKPTLLASRQRLGLNDDEHHSACTLTLSVGIASDLSTDFLLQLATIKGMYITPSPLHHPPACVQMSGYVIIGKTQPSKGQEALLALLRMETATRSNLKGYCVLPGLTAVETVALEAGLQLSVGVVMCLLYLLVAACQGCRQRRRCCCPPKGASAHGYGSAIGHRVAWTWRPTWTPSSSGWTHPGEEEEEEEEEEAAGTEGCAATAPLRSAKRVARCL